MGERHRAEPAHNIENRLRQLRLAKGLSQADLAASAGITRQAVCAIEATQYLPTTAVALRLAGALQCRVEDLFNLVTTGDLVQGDLIGTVGLGSAKGKPVRVKLVRVGSRLIVRPVAHLGDMLNYTIPADGLLVGGLDGSGRPTSRRATVRLLRDRRAIDQEIAIAGCDPAVFLAGEYLRRRQAASTVVGWTMGSAAALEALKRGEVHMAGLHLVDAKSGESNLPYLRRHLKGEDFTIVTFASWEEGFLVRAGNPKGIRSIDDVVRPNVVLINREVGSGARALLDRLLAEAGVPSARVQGYQRSTSSHFHVARLIAEGQADVGIGVRAAANQYGLDFIPIQPARYDLVTSKTFLATHPSLSNLLDTIVSRPFRTEVETLGGYDMTEAGKIRTLRAG